MVSLSSLGKAKKRKASQTSSNTFKILSASLLAVVVPGCYYLSQQLKFADTRQTIAMPMYITSAILLESSVRPAVDTLIETRSALPNADKVEFKDTQLNVIQNQIREMNALGSLLTQRGKAVAYLEIVHKDLIEQIEIGVLSKDKHAKMLGDLKELAQLSESHRTCLEETNKLKSTLEAGLARQDHAVKTIVASSRNLVDRIQGRDLVRKCADQSARPVEITERVIAAHDENVAAFNQVAARQQSIRTFLTSLSAVALFFFGSRAKDGFVLVWKRLNARSKLPWKRRVALWAKQQIVLPKRRFSFWP